MLGLRQTLLLGIKITLLSLKSYLIRTFWSFFDAIDDEEFVVKTLKLRGCLAKKYIIYLYMCIIKTFVECSSLMIR